MDFSGVLGTLGTAAGIVIAIGIFVLAAWFVARARRGNRVVRSTHDDPHARRAGSGTQRDIPQ